VIDFFAGEATHPTENAFEGITGIKAISRGSRSGAWR
jgi:hypothetical protein